MKIENAKPCPFCGQVPNTWDLVELSDDDYTLSHHCPHKEGELSVCMNAYGETKEEVVDLWNHRYNDCPKEGDEDEENEEK